MKRIWRGVVALVVLAQIFAVNVLAQSANDGKRCDLGFKYQISYQESWGDSYAVVAEVVPEGPADQAGLRVGDVIISVNGKNTKAISEEELIVALGNVREGEVDFVIRRPNLTNHKLKLYKNCIPFNALSEAQMAESFSMYSLEDVSQREFTMPFRNYYPQKVDFGSYSTFSFPKATGLSEVEKLILSDLERKGYKYTAEGGDLQVQVRYALVENREHRPGEVEDVNAGLKNYRVDLGTMNMRTYPFLSINSPSFSGSHRLEVDIELYDKSNNKVWGVSAREKLNSNYDPVDYFRSFTPLLLSNFPLAHYLTNPVYALKELSYRYTGIYFDAQDLRKVAWVDKGSPAEIAGVHIGDKIVAINGLPMHSSVADVTDAYLSFVKDSWEMRDEETIFPNASGLRNSMYWRVDKYLSVADMIQQPKYKAVFSYLFSHRTYVNSPIVKDIVVEVERDGEMVSILVQPELKQLDYLTFK